MAEGKKSFLLYCDIIHTVKHLPKEKQADLFMHILSYVNDENPQTDDILIKLAFEPIKHQLKRDLVKYEEIKEERSINGKLGNLKRYNTDLYDRVIAEEITIKEAEKLAKTRKHRKSENDVANVAVNDTVNDTVTVIQQKTDAVDFDVYKTQIADEGKTVWMEGFYMTYKLKPQTFSFVVDDFILHLKCQDETKHPKNLKDFKKYLYNWCNRIEPEGKLNQYKKNQPKQNGQL